MWQLSHIKSGTLFGADGFRGVDYG